MVEKINAEGRAYELFLEEMGLGRDSDFRVMKFRQGDSRREITLAKLREEPEFDGRSVLVEGAVLSTGSLVDVLAVPKDCPYLGDRQELPEEGTTYVARVVGNAEKRPIKLLILAWDMQSAVNTARVLGEAVLRRPPFACEVDEIDRHEFMAEAKRQIDRGLKLPQMILRYGDLLEYQAKSDNRRSASK